MNFLGLVQTKLKKKHKETMDVSEAALPHLVAHARNAAGRGSACIQCQLYHTKLEITTLLECSLSLVRQVLEGGFYD